MFEGGESKKREKISQQNYKYKITTSEQRLGRVAFLVITTSTGHFIEEKEDRNERSRNMEKNCRKSSARTSLSFSHTRSDWFI